MRYFKLVTVLLLIPHFCFAIEVNNFYGVYDTGSKNIGEVASTLKGPISEFWISPQKPTKIYNIAVLVPHLKDGYWKSVWYGVEGAAKKLGVKLTLLDAGGV